MLKPTRTSIVAELKQIAASPESVSLHRFIGLVAAALVLLLERK